MMRVIGVSYAMRLRHIDLFQKMPIKKDIIDIKLANSLLAIKCNAKLSIVRTVMGLITRLKVLWKSMFGYW